MPERVSAHLTGGMPTEQYTVTILPISILGEEGDPIRASFVWPGEAFDPNRIPTADILNLSVQGDTVVDASDNHYTITSIGSAEIANDQITFQKEGCVKVVGIDQHYPAMQEGFSIEMTLTTGSDVQSFQCPLSDQHSGGFGFVISGSSLRFKVHDPDSYAEVIAGIQPNTTYHVVGVFDGSFISIYVNGILAASATVNGEMKLPTMESARYLSIGSDSNSTGTGEHFSDAIISSVRIYSAVLLDSQVSLLADSAMAN